MKASLAFWLSKLVGICVPVEWLVCWEHVTGVAIDMLKVELRPLRWRHHIHQFPFDRFLVCHFLLSMRVVLFDLISLSSIGDRRRILRIPHSDCTVTSIVN